MGIQQMDPAIQRHIEKSIRTQENLIRNAIEAELGTAARRVDLATTGAFRQAFGGTNQIGILQQRDIDQLTKEFNDLANSADRGLKNTVEVSDKLEKEILKSGKLDRTVFADKLLGIASSNRQRVSALHASVVGIIGFDEYIAYKKDGSGNTLFDKNRKPVKTLNVENFNKMFTEFVRHIDNLNIAASSLFSATDLLPTFQNWLDTRYPTNTGTSAATAYSSISGFSGPLVEGEHGLINKRFKEFIIESGRADQVLADYIGLNTDAGHILGLFNIRLIRLLGIDPNSEIKIALDSSGLLPQVTVTLDPKTRNLTSTKEIADLQKLSEIYSAIFQQMSTVDFLTSSFIDSPQGINTYIDFVKENFKLLGNNITINPSVVSLQISWFNRKAGAQLSNAATALSSLIRKFRETANSITVADFSNFFKTFEGLDTYVKTLADTINSSTLRAKIDAQIVGAITANSTQMTAIIINTPGSDNIPTSLVKSLKALFEDTQYNPKPTKFSKPMKPIVNKVSRPKPKTAKVATTSKTTTTATANKISKMSKSINLQVNKMKDQARQRKTGMSLTSLQNIINGGLFEQIRKNMGTGSRRDVLNFRTGRLAESAVVQRMSESREGMITAFYTYMKNPYATFSRGGLQERPFTRDPKTLISKSIRELAAPMVANRMRAVLV